MIIFLPRFILAGIWANFRTLTHSSRLAVRSAAYSFPVIIHWVRASDSLQETHAFLVTNEAVKAFTGAMTIALWSVGLVSCGIISLGY